MPWKIILVLLLTAPVLAADRYFSVTEADLTSEPRLSSAFLNQSAGRIHVHMDGDTEAYILSPWRLRDSGNRPTPRLLIRTSSPDEPTGHVVENEWIARGREASPRVSRITVNAEPSDDARDLFHIARLLHYSDLQFSAAHGGAFFRYQANASRNQIPKDQLQQVPEPWRFGRERAVRAEYDLFTGGRAISENLQLDRSLRLDTAAGQGTVSLDTVPGITVAEMDFAALLGDATPALDAIAAIIPEDQYAIFFPTPQGLFDTLDHAGRATLIATGGVLPLADEQQTLGRYQRMLGIELDQMARLLGPTLIRSAAITGSDPFFALGTDVAMVYESPSPAALRTAMLTRISAEASARGITPRQEQIAGVACTVFRSESREMCSYLAAIGNRVIVANSPAQITALAAANAKDRASLASLPEYRFFRKQYPLGDKAESLLVIIPDAAIRKWCSATWRIADARRITARAQQLDALARAVAEGEVKPDVADDVYGSLDFATPIAELSITTATTEEVRAYEQWRDQYQQNWRGAFDPIALRASFTADRFAGDLTIMPLIAGTEYSRYIGLTRGGALKPTSGDPHNALLHFVMAINRDSELLKMASAQGRAMAGLQIDPLAWVGDSVSLYVDDDPVWAEVAAGGKGVEKEHASRLPVALRAESNSPLRLAAFLAAVRGMIEQTAPGLTRWDNFEHAGRPYIRVTSTERDGAFDDIAIYYAATPDALVVTLSEELLKRALSRAAGPGDPAAQRPEPTPWLGSSIALQIRPSAVDLARIFDFDQSEPLQATCFANIPILNEWKRLFPDEDPVAFHERMWNQRITCPAGGTYVWNDEFKTMESTVLGSPIAPKQFKGPSRLFGNVALANFGLTFENEGLRARVEIDAAKAAAEAP